MMTGVDAARNESGYPHRARVATAGFSVRPDLRNLGIMSHDLLLLPGFRPQSIPFAVLYDVILSEGNDMVLPRCLSYFRAFNQFFILN